MRRSRSALLGLALLLLAAGDVSAQAAGGTTSGTGGSGRRPAGIPEPQPGEPLCGWCGTTGRTPVDVEQKFKVEADKGTGWSVHFCSEAIDADNHGLDWKPCARCKTPSLQALALKTWEQKTGALKTWLEGRRKVDRLLAADSPLVHVQTSHFLVTWNVPKITLSTKQTLRAHEAAHLYARRMEEVYARFQELFGITDADNMKNLHYLYIFEEPAQSAIAGPLFTALSAEDASTVKRAGGASNESAIVTWWNRAEFPKDVDMHRHQIHNVVHALTAIYYNLHWFKPGERGLSPPWLSDKYGWLDEGLPHWFEIQFDGRAATYCFREGNTNDRWGSDSWKKNIFKAVAAGDVPSFPEVSTKPGPALTAKEHQFVWSWVDFLLARDKAVMGKALRLCKQKAETRDIIRECWGLTVLDFEQSWSAWVLETYAPTKK